MGSFSKKHKNKSGKSMKKYSAPGTQVGGPSSGYPIRRGSSDHSNPPDLKLVTIKIAQSNCKKAKPSMPKLPWDIE